MGWQGCTTEVNQTRWRLATSPRACARPLGAVIGTFAGLDRFSDPPGLKRWQLCGPICIDLTGSKVCWQTHTKERMDVVADEDKRASWSAPLNFCHSFNNHKTTRGLWFPPGPLAVRHRRVFTPCLPQSQPDLFLPQLRPLSAVCLLKRPSHHLIVLSNPLISFMSSPPNPTPPSPPKTFDNSRLPAYRSSYLGRYHPYPRTRAPAREVVMVSTILQNYSNIQYRRPYSPCSPLRKVSTPKRTTHRLRRTPIR